MALTNLPLSSTDSDDWPVESDGSDWKCEADEQVEVDQRGLIDKILARYSAKFAVLRELLQNADDAKSTQVNIRFETSAMKDSSIDSPDLHSDVLQWTIINNGNPFSDNDWDRLKNIGNGNPDNRSIGAFGVGFYSVFSITDTPSVTSNKPSNPTERKRMYFHWEEVGGNVVNGKQTKKKERLFVKESCKVTERSPWTIFELPVLKASPIPEPIEIGQFLASSLPFMTTIQTVSVYLDRHLLMRFDRSLDNSERVPLLQTLKPTSGLGLMTVQSVNVAEVRTRAQIARWLTKDTESSSSSPFVSSQSTFRLWTAQADVSPEKNLRDGLKKAMKKEIPSYCEFRLLYTTQDEYEVNQKQDGTGAEIFSSLRADLSRNKAYVYIGHATMQTTGIAAHLASRFVPTVERALIDYQNQDVKTWNEELLYVGGYLARMIYELEISNIKTSSMLSSRSIYCLQYFAFRKSTPNGIVSDLTCKAFFGCSTESLSILSSGGILPAGKVRDYDPACALFMKGVHMLDPYVAEQARDMVRTLKAEGIIKSVSLLDVMEELSNRTFEEDEMVQCLHWVMNHAHELMPKVEDRRSFLKAAKFKHNTSERIIRLENTKSFLDREDTPFIDSQYPLPDDTLPASVSEGMSTDRLLKNFEWRKLSAVDWIAYVLSPISIESLHAQHNVTFSEGFTEVVLEIIAKLAYQGTVPHKILDRLKELECIPTQKGMRRPPHVYTTPYIASAFPDLPVATFEDKSSHLHDVLINLGVREYVDLVDLPSCLQGCQTIHLLHYFFHHKVSTGDKAMLKELPLFQRASEEAGADPLDTARFTAEGLYRPSDELKKLGLPIIAYEEQAWNDKSDEAKLLYELGLRRWPDVRSLLQIAESRPDRRETALRYFLDNYSQYRSDYDLLLKSKHWSGIKFIPAIKKDGVKHTTTIYEVFGDIRCQIMGFSTVEETFRDDHLKLKIYPHPDIPKIIDVIRRNPPRDFNTAKLYFEYSLLSKSQGNDEKLNRSSDLSDLSASSFIPVGDALMAPQDCYHGQSEREWHSELFDFVDFGESGNHFLYLCGSKLRPSVDDIAAALARNPEHFYELTGDPKAYLGELKRILAHKQDISQETWEALTQAPILLGSRSKPQTSFEDDVEYEEYLLSPQEVVILDDERNYYLFRDISWLFFVPYVDLESAYKDLGCRRLSEYIEEIYDPVLPQFQNHSWEIKYRNLVLERLPMFLDNKDSLRMEEYERIRDPAIFKVKVFNELQTTKVLKIGEKEESRPFQTTVGCWYKEDDSFELGLAVRGSLDNFQIASCIARHFYGNPTSHVCLLLMTLMTTELSVLKNQGYRVLEEPSNPEPNDKVNVHFVSDSPTQARAENFYPSFLRFFNNNTRQVPVPDEVIDRELDEAVTCPAGQGENLRRSSKVSLVKDKRNRLCAGSKYSGVLKEMEKLPSGYAVYVGKGISREDVQKRLHVMETFVDKIVVPLQQVFPPFSSETLRILVDPKCDQLALNRKGRIYLNVNQFEKKHYKQVEKGELYRALLSWYFILAHEFTVL